MLRCLIVEDNPINWMILERLAAQQGMAVSVCHNGVEALEHCRLTGFPDLVLLDGIMPEMDGITFLKFLRDMPGGAQPYVVFCSSSLDRADVTIALDLGAECHFPKPVTRDQIVYAMHQAAQRRTRQPAW